MVCRPRRQLLHGSCSPNAQHFSIIHSRVCYIYITQADDDSTQSIVASTSPLSSLHHPQQPRRQPAQPPSSWQLSPFCALPRARARSPSAACKCLPPVVSAWHIVKWMPASSENTGRIMPEEVGSENGICETHHVSRVHHLLLSQLVLTLVFRYFEGARISCCSPALQLRKAIRFVQRLHQAR